MSNRFVISVDGVDRVVAARDGVTAEQLNEAIAEALPGVAADQLPSARALAGAEEREAARRAYAAAFDGLVAEALSYPRGAVRGALASVGRKGWGLRGLSAEKLAAVVDLLRRGRAPGREGPAPAPSRTEGPVLDGAGGAVV